MLPEKFPLVSVVITSCNSAATISRCLQSVNEQDYPKEKIEIVLVDNHSSDHTLAIAKRFTDKIFICGPERSAQRNCGIHKARGKYILYLDSDMSLSKQVVSECVGRCENEKVSALYIPERITGPGFWLRVRKFERTFYEGTCIDAVRFLRKAVVLEIGGFDEALTGPEDWDFSRRINDRTKTSIIKVALYHNEPRFNFARFVKKKCYYAMSFDKYVRKWGKDDPIIRKQLGFSYRFWGVFTENGKWKRLLIHPLSTIAMYLLRSMVGFKYLKHLARKKT